MWQLITDLLVTNTVSTVTSLLEANHGLGWVSCSSNKLVFI